MRNRFRYSLIWLLWAAALYFFENNTGTRIVLLGSLGLCVLTGMQRFRELRRKAGAAPARRGGAVRNLRPEETEPGDVRPWLPGEPLNRIHWKLSAKQDCLLIREAEPGEREEKKILPSADKNWRKWILPADLGSLLLLLCLLFVLPAARQGAGMLANRLFEASEAVNAYAYRRIDTGVGGSPALAGVLLGAAVCVLAGITALLGSRAGALSLMGACALFQIYFGLSLPAAVNAALFVLFALWTAGGERKDGLRILAGAAAVSLAVLLLFPGVDAATETASEKARDWLSRLASGPEETLPEEAEGWAEARHLQQKSLAEGSGEAGEGAEFRLETLEEQQISRPEWFDWVKTALLLLAMTGALVLPFVPFRVLDRRREREREIRKAILAEDPGEGARAAFQQVIRWLEAAGRGRGNLPYREWAEQLEEGKFPKGYRDRFAAGARIFEEASYSGHPVEEAQRQQVLELLRETEEAVRTGAGTRERLRLKYLECLWI